MLRPALLVEDVERALVGAVQPHLLGDVLVVGVGPILGTPNLEVDPPDQLVACRHVLKGELLDNRVV